MSQKFEKLKTLLKELFQLDHPDLDFGLYRIMHAKAAEVTQFLERDLLPQVKQEFGQYKTADKAELELQLAKAVEQAAALGADPDSLPKVKELRAKLTGDAVDLNALESEVYDHLYSFFRRYYSDGDFLSKRVYKPGVYAIPYEGEEVKLHWANADQYYIKTSEYLRDYAFRLRPDDESNPMRVHFRLVEAAEGEHGNVKAAEGKDRIFVLAVNDFITEDDGDQGKELVIRFEYRPATLTDWPADVRDSKKKPPTQKDMTALAEASIAAVADTALAKWIGELGKPHIKSDGERTEYSRLHAHLSRYVARNTFDYFIHKDLGGFLRRELDFYVKNEVMHLDDIDGVSAPRIEQYISKLRVIRRIAGKIIEFLAQLEDFQKKLWLKKKFVVETNYCIAVGSIPEEFYAEIAANEAQRQEWVDLLAIDEIEKDLTTPGYSEPLTPEFFRAYPTLMIDTAHFGEPFTALLLDKIFDLDEVTDGFAINGENRQALSLLQSRFDTSVQCIYIDPPYNTGNDGFLYKDNYQHSTWLSMIGQTLPLARRLMASGGVFFASCDDNEVARLRFHLDNHFGDHRFESQIIIQSNKRGQTYKSIAKTHEYLLVYDADDTTILNGIPKDLEDGEQDEWGRYELWELRNRNPKFGRFNRPNLFFPIFASPTEVEEKGFSCVSLVRTKHFSEEVLPRNSEQADSCWRWSTPKVQEALDKCDRVLIAKRGSAGWRIWEKSRKAFKAPKSIWTDTGVINEKGTVELGHMGLTGFVFPKPGELLRTVVQIGSSETDFVLDYFAGTGTTGQAVVERNREDGSSRKFMLIEVGEHFDSTLIPRLKKVVYCPDWNNGKPRRAATPEEAGNSPRLIKYTRLESYEDALNNLQLRRSKAQQSLLEIADNSETSRLKEQYMLGYMLNVETEGSQSLLNVQGFIDPTAYKLKFKRPGSDESREVNVDLLETFNWLIGLTVHHIAAPQCFEAKFERDTENRLQLKSRVKQVESTGHWFRTVTGKTPDGRKTLVIWRKRPGGETVEGVEQDNLVLDEWFTRQGYSSKDSEFDLIYVNGTNNLENLRAPDDTWKVRLIEDDFHRLMFASEGI